MTIAERQQVALRFLEGFTGSEISSQKLRKAIEGRTPRSSWRLVIAFIIDGTHGWMMKKATLYRITRS